MKRLIPWIVLTAMLAVIFHLAGMWYLPRYMTNSHVERIRARRNLPFNQFNHGELRAAKNDPVPMDNPDTKVSFAAYDVSKGPVRIRCRVPDLDNYWSLSLYAWNTDNFYVVNDRTARAKEFDLVLIKRGMNYQKSKDEEVIVAPTEKGVALVRMIVTDRDNKEELARMTDYQKRTVIEQLDNISY